MQNSSIKSSLAAPPLAKSIRGGGKPSPAGTFVKTPTFSYPPGSTSSSAKKLKRVTLSEHVEIEGLKSPLKINLPENGPPGREEYIEYALDMLIHNLICSGQLNATQAHLVKTPELRSHISALVDRVEQAHKAGMTTQISSKSSTHKAVTKWALQPNALPITIITDKDPRAKPERRPFSNSRSVWSTPVPLEKKRINTLSIPVSTKLKAQGGLNKEKANTSTTAVPETQQPKFAPVAKQQTTDTGSNIESEPSASTGIGKIRPESAPPSSLNNAGSLLHDSSVDNFRLKTTISVSNDGGFRAKFDMRGFENEEISLDLRGHKLTVTGTRPRRDEMNERKTIETVEIPQGVDVEHLKVARRVDGILLIQESPVMERREIII